MIIIYHSIYKSFIKYPTSKQACFEVPLKRASVILTVDQGIYIKVMFR